MPFDWPILSMLIWLPIAAGVLLLLLGDQRAPDAAAARGLGDRDRLHVALDADGAQARVAERAAVGVDGEEVAAPLARDLGLHRRALPRARRERLVLERHDRVEVVCIEGGGDRFEHVHRRIVVHGRVRPAPLYVHGEGRWVSGSRSGSTSVCSAGSAAGT